MTARRRAIRPETAVTVKNGERALARLAAGHPLTIELRAEDGQRVTLTAADGEVQARVGRSEQGHLRISGPRRAIVRLLAARSDLGAAAAAGVSLEGNAAVLARLGQASPPTEAA